MRIRSVSYHALFNLGDYENEKIELIAQLEEDETPEEVIPQLREKVQALAQPSAAKAWNERTKLQGELHSIQVKLTKARQEWEATAEFLRSQGIKTDVAPMPEFSKLLNPASSEGSEVIEGEIDGTPF